ncbi:hypothetical protein, partial [Nonomuraea sp. KM90]|uniref:hypothetical protein n=1 Tax=Nonomuraea sp. KM90 TaxID=3457428 RepID=UPI003FCC7EEC
PMGGRQIVGTAHRAMRRGPGRHARSSSWPTAATPKPNGRMSSSTGRRGHLLFSSQLPDLER